MRAGQESTFAISGLAAGLAGVILFSEVQTAQWNANSGILDVDNVTGAFYAEGGSSLTIAGTLSNSSSDGNALDIGNGNITTADTVTASGLSNTGAINIEGSATVQATLDITAAAGFGTAGTVTGSIFLQNDALLEFASGQLTTIIVLEKSPVSTTT